MSKSNSNDLKLDLMIHQPNRLQIMAQLFVVEEADMLFLKQKTGLTWGNLSSHATKLEEEGYVIISKSIVEKRTRTVLGLTDEGREAFENYRRSILSLLGI